MFPSKHSSCTTILVGKNATYDGSTIIARNEDAGEAVHPKKFVVLHHEDQPRHYQSKLSKFSLDLPDNPVRYTSVPDVAVDEGVWGEAGININNIAMSATETITTNSRVLGADPFVKNGFGEEDLLTITLPYIKSAREGVKRVGQLLKKYGTYEPNGIIFSDVNEIWYMETAGGHHWVAQRIPDDAYVIAPNQTGIQEVKFDDPDNFMFPKDLLKFVQQNHLNLTENFNFRKIFGSDTQSDHHYNTPRAWYGQRYLSPSAVKDKTPMSNDLSFINYADHKITIEDIKYILSSHYQDTPYDPFTPGANSQTSPYRPIGFNRNQELSLLQIRPYVQANHAAIQWLAFAENPFNTLTPFYTNVLDTPDCYRDTTKILDSHNAYWANRLISLIVADHYQELIADVETYQQATLAYGHQRIAKVDKAVENKQDSALMQALSQANERTADRIMKDTEELLTKLVIKASENSRGAFTNGHSHY
ncbi:C69 family dipeptidase [Lentilactobacillus kisonensis]|uniref:Dipeptidase n=1 Tax=Lentilactobacillus kisonensis DSM 19906 = JCM 15041 TaxID=1423766 RepID=A0A0R1NSU4_9LACO|nr:C69 family dipeptidase [Lentilactobacillus kisonensis]KRL23389.1 dipeptidase [Lentilactobacillus kisonensis DSM 19906 = JCM 15041]